MGTKPDDGPATAGLPAGASLDVARAVMQTSFMGMEMARTTLRRHGHGGLSVPQFRLLITLRELPGLSLAQAAEHMNLSRPAASRLADGLVGRGLVTRETTADDRRRVALGLSDEGRQLLHGVDDMVVAAVADMLGGLSVDEQAIVTASMDVLRRVFAARLDVDTVPFGRA
ncbi:MAG: MarR family transcriptional regulator [Armatimonadetes bacterium]|nr:MarR family transcriptional regulator [Armatimonadota bacterium]